MRLLTSAECLRRYGFPKAEDAMVVYRISTKFAHNVLPDKIYCNRDMVVPLELAFKLIIERDLERLIESWDGCFNIRAKKGASNSFSLHSWGVAIDINATTNAFGAVPQMDKRLVSCFKEAGFDWGGNWKKPDGMHFQLSANTLNR